MLLTEKESTVPKIVFYKFCRIFIEFFSDHWNHEIIKIIGIGSDKGAPVRVGAVSEFVKNTTNISKESG